MLPEALVSHQTLSTPKVSYIRQFRRAHPKGELETIHVLHSESIMSTRLQYLVHFIQQAFLEIIYYSTRVQSGIIKQRKENKHLAETIQGSVCAHQKNPPQKSYTYNRGKINPEYTMYSQDLPDQWEQFPDSQGYDRQYGFVVLFLFTESITNSLSLQSSFISSYDYFIS